MSFDLLAPHYRWMEYVLAGEKLHRCRTAFLDEVPAARNILLLGEGNGRSLVECARRFGTARITCMDASAAMLAQARRRLDRQVPEVKGVSFVNEDVLKWVPTGEGYDLVITNFFLDCFRRDQLEKLIPRIALATVTEANWLIADFQVSSGGARRVRSRLILWSMYVFFRAFTQLPAKRLTTPDSILEHAGFMLHRRTEADWGLLHSDWWLKRGKVG